MAIVQTHEQGTWQIPLVFSFNAFYNELHLYNLMNQVIIE